MFKFHKRYYFKYDAPPSFDGPRLYVKDIETLSINWSITKWSRKPKECTRVMSADTALNIVRRLREESGWNVVAVCRWWFLWWHEEWIGAKS